MSSLPDGFDSPLLVVQQDFFLDLFSDSPYFLNSNYSFMSSGIDDLIEDSDALPRRKFSECYFYTSVKAEEPIFHQNHSDFFALDFSPSVLSPFYVPSPPCDTREVTAGVEETVPNLNEWMRADGWVTTSIGFGYAGTKKLDFSVCFEYCLGVHVTMGEEFISVPVTLRIWRRDCFLYLRELVLYVSSPSDRHIPARYSTSPLLSDIFKSFAKRFKWNGRKVIEKKSGLRVFTSNAALKFRKTVEWMLEDKYWRMRWSTLTPKVLAGQVMVLADAWMADAEVYAEYWLVNAHKLAPFSS
ncbi:hypothetical protein AAF712_016378 [Marasmius tenuissimus]|uniref:Uncharacterized protein n=1 Tax=Marasmius tenuissimus TaxID=585030 RepID=A0ABR2Z6Y3_9AGAR